MSKKKITKKELMRELKVLFLGWELLALLFALLAVHAMLFYFLTKNVWFTAIMSVIGMVFFFYVFVYPNRKLKKHQYHLGELLKYVTNMTFFLQTGDNILHALKSTKRTVDKEIQKDIQKTIDILEKDAKLVTDHFEKYDFPSLEQFHRNLNIKYEHGGDTADLFSQIQKNIIFELKKRDELYKKRKNFAMNVYVLLGMVGSMSLILRLVAPMLWEIFLEMSVISLSVMAITYGLILLNLYMLQRHNLDITVRL